MSETPTEVEVEDQGDFNVIRTISSCQKELDDIQGLLQGISTDIKTKIDEKSLATNAIKDSPDFERKSSLFASDEITSLMGCTEDKFEEHTNRMSMTDLDLMQRTIEAETRVLKIYLQQNHGLDQNEIDDSKAKIDKLEQRMYKLIRKRGQATLTRRGSEDVNFDGHADNDDDDDNIGYSDDVELETSSPCILDRYGTRDNVVPKEIENLSKDELVELLRVNSIDVHEQDNRENLLQLVCERLLSDAHKVSRHPSWEPPDQSTLKWNVAVEIKDDKEEDEKSKSLTKDHSKPMEIEVKDEKPPKSPDSISSQPPDTPMQSYFVLNPSDMDNYLHYKAANDEKLVDWNPTTLLKELYSKISSGSRALKRAPSKSKRVSCMQGYLDKLPMNQTKVKAFKGWRRRFFQIARGRLYYYEDHKSETPFGSIEVLGSKIEGDDSSYTITIQSRLDNKKLVLRCGAQKEWKDWLETLRRMATIDPPVPGTLKREGSLKKRGKNGPLIIDLGASTVRAGLATDNIPVLAFPAAFSVKKVDQARSGHRFTQSGLPDPHSCRCGFEAFYPEIRKDAKVVYPLKPTLRIDKYAVKIRYVPGFLERIVRDLEIEAADRTVVISHSSHLSDRDKEILLDYLFEQMCINAVYMQQQALLALYSYGVTTGLIVDIGDHIDVIPVIDGIVIEKGVMCLPFAGQQVTEYLGKLLTESGYRLFTDIESYVVRFVKEETAEVSLDFQEDMTSSPKAVDVDIEKFNLPDDRKTIKVGNIKYRCTEGLFNPALFGKDVTPLHSMIERAIKACDIDQRRVLCKNIYLSGGTSMLPGLVGRLEDELRSCFPDTVMIKVTAGEDRVNAAYKGGIVMAGLSNFKDNLITKQDWLTGKHEELLAKWR